MKKVQMKIVTVHGLIGVIEVMRQYQKAPSKVDKELAQLWQDIVDNFISDWNENGINGSTYLFENTPERG
jgi:hypothetical protein